jgi:hypothetical protein
MILRHFPSALAIVIGVALLTGAAAQDLKPKLGPQAIPIQQSHEFLRAQPAPDYWALSPYYEPQATDSACSVAAIAMLVNALRGLPLHAKDKLVTQRGLLEAVGDTRWIGETAQGGAGVTWRGFVDRVSASLKAYGIDARIEVLKPRDNAPATLEQVRVLLADNEASDRDIVLVYFAQGVLTGDWDGPHISPVGAYDAERHRVLIMDVDRQWYVPYWSGDETLLEAMLRPAPPTMRALAGETGGLIRVTLTGAARLVDRGPDDAALAEHAGEAFHQTDGMPGSVRPCGCQERPSRPRCHRRSLSGTSRCGGTSRRTSRRYRSWDRSAANA